MHRFMDASCSNCNKFSHCCNNDLICISKYREKEQECEELKKKKEENEKFYLTRYVNKESRCLELEDERNYYKQALDEIEINISKYQGLTFGKPRTMRENDCIYKILDIINKAKERK